MSTLLAMCCYDTIENKRSEYTFRTLDCLEKTVDYRKHRIIVIDNNSCQETKETLRYFSEIRPIIEVITIPENVGTARAINKAWKLRVPGQHCIKMDNDVVINSINWVEAMEEAIERDPKIGIVGLKRKDCAERPDSNNEWYKSALYFLAHEPGQSWIPFEEVQHVMGTCQMYSSKYLDVSGYLYQPGIYGFDDSLSSLRARVAGFKVGFLPHINIDHIDINETPYWEEKRVLAGNDMQEYNKICEEYISGKRSIYWKDPE